MNRSAYITNIQKFSLHDGPGIRTAVFIKGCGLSCKWCGNPETIQACPQLMYYRNKCIACGKCVLACPQGALELTADGIVISKDRCHKTGLCTEVCPSAALILTGEMKTSDEVFVEINQDKVFYLESGGGVTFSGGEPFLQADFAGEVARKCKEEGYGVAAETCGYFDLSKVLKIIHNFDLILFDIKIIDNKKHIKYCGQSNESILKNFDTLLTLTDVIPRVPIIPTINDSPEDIDLLCNFFNKYKGKIKKIHILPYHNLGIGKYEALSQEYTLGHIEIPGLDYMKKIKKRIEKVGFDVLIGG